MRYKKESRREIGSSRIIKWVGQPRIKITKNPKDNKGWLKAEKENKKKTSLGESQRKQKANKKELTRREVKIRIDERAKEEKEHNSTKTMIKQ